MMANQTPNLSNNDLTEIRDAVPSLDLRAIRSLKRAGFNIVRRDIPDGEAAAPVQHSGWQPGRPAAEPAA